MFYLCVFFLIIKVLFSVVSLNILLYAFTAPSVSLGFRTVYSNGLRSNFGSQKKQKKLPFFTASYDAVI